MSERRTRILTSASYWEEAMDPFFQGLMSKKELRKLQKELSKQISSEVEMDNKNIRQLENVSKDAHHLCALIDQYADPLSPIKHSSIFKRLNQHFNNMFLRDGLIEFLEANNWLNLEDRENATGIVDCYLDVFKGIDNDN